MTADAFGEAQKELLRTLTHHMILMAERAHVMSNQKANSRILENADCIWRGKAIFEWETVSFDTASCHGENLHPLARHFFVQQPGQLESTGTCGSYSPQPLEPSSALSLEPLPDLVLPDICDVEPTCWANNVNEKFLHGHCVSCFSAVATSGMSSSCLSRKYDLSIDWSPKLRDNILAGPEPSGCENSTYIDGLNSSCNPFNWSDIPHFGMEDSCGVYTASTRPSVHDLSKNGSEHPWYPDVGSEPKSGTQETLPDLSSAMIALDEPTFEHELKPSNDHNEGEVRPGLVERIKRNPRNRNFLAFARGCKLSRFWAADAQNLKTCVSCGASGSGFSSAVPEVCV